MGMSRGSKILWQGILLSLPFKNLSFKKCKLQCQNEEEGSSEHKFPFFRLHLTSDCSHSMGGLKFHQKICCLSGLKNQRFWCWKVRRESQKRESQCTGASNSGHTLCREQKLETVWRKAKRRKLKSEQESSASQSVQVHCLPKQNRQQSQ